MIYWITGATHTGKTALAQRLMEARRIPYLSLDHLKMGLIRSGLVDVTPTSPWREITGAVWPVAREMARTCLENRQSLIVEGCYVPDDWERDFDAAQRAQMRCVCIALSDEYIDKHFDQVLRCANAVERRLDDDVSAEALKRENAFFRARFPGAFTIHEDYVSEMDELFRRIK